MYLPNELFYIILSFRESHPIAKLIAEAVKNDDAYFNQKSEETKLVKRFHFTHLVNRKQKRQDTLEKQQ